MLACGNKFWLSGLFSGDEGDYLDVWVIKGTIKTNQIDIQIQKR